MLFYNCSSLTSIEFPEGITSIGTCAFSNCSSLTSIEFSNSITNIGDYAFSYCSVLTSIELPEGITRIGNSAFSSCSSLTSVELPEGITSIGISAFSNCSSLTSIELPNSITNIGDYAFYHCSGLTSIELPEGITRIGSSAFSSCSSLTSVELPEGITSIGISAFSNCSSLTSIELPKGITSIGNSAFFNCSSLTSIEIPKGITSIASSVFSKCSGLTSIELPEGITSIGNEAFYYCSSLTSIEFPAGITSIGYSAFYCCSGLTSIELPEGITSINNDTFAGCSSLTSIKLPSEIKNIGKNAFSGCNSLTSVKIPNSVKTIGDSAFRYCYKLTNVEFPEGITSIGEYSFYECKGLTSVKIPHSLTSIGSSAFGGCNNMDLVIIDNNTIASGLTTSSSNGYLTNYATTVAIRFDIVDIGSYITDSFTNVTALNMPAVNGGKLSYVVYSKHSHADDSDIWGEVDENDIQTCGTCGLEKVVHVCSILEEIPAVLPTPSVKGMTAGAVCTECGKTVVEPREVTIEDMANMGDPNFRIDAVSLDLAESICVFYKVKFSEDLAKQYMVFEFGGEEFVITEHLVEDGTGRYVYRFTGAPAYKMAENIVAYVYAETSEGVYVRNQLPTYSIMQYCVNQLKKSSISDEFRTVISDVLALGAANQIYEGYKTDELVTDLVKNMGYKLTPTEYSGIDESKNIQAMVGDRYATTNWSVANLVIGSNINVQLKLVTENVENVTVKISVAGEDRYFSAKDFKTEGDKYVVVIDYLTSKQYDEAITATLYENGEQVGGVLTYSINSYLYRNAEKSEHSEAMRTLLSTLYVYGETMKSYFKN